MVNRDVGLDGGYTAPPKIVTIIRERVEACPVYYTAKELATVLEMSVKWVEKWRHDIVGTCKVGRQWRFSRAAIDSCIATGKDVRKSKSFVPPSREIHITKRTRCGA